MVLSALLKFPASALTYVGNYAGPCYIHLNGEAIVVRYETGVVINKWPYNCIRQFRAEDETGKFSFVSGRRGPYGVAEYNFKLPNDSLSLLQSALTNFTGAQFSSVAPGSGSGGDQQPQQQPQQQQPPQYPPRQAYSVSTAYQTTPRSYVGHGGRESVSSVNYSDNVFQSPSHSQQIPVPLPNSSSSSQGSSPRPPRLPPRDYSMTSISGGHSGSVSSEQSNSFTHSLEESMIRGQNKARSMTGSSTASSFSNTSTDAGYVHAMTPPTLPPRRPSHERAPDSRVAQGPTYNEVNLQQAGKDSKKFSRSSTVDVLRPPPPVPSKKVFDRPKEGAGPSTASEMAEDPQDKPEYANSSEAESSLDALHVTRSQLEQDRVSSAAKDSPYDHLPSEKAALEAAAKANQEESDLDDNRPSSISPEQNIPNGKKSPLQDDDLELHRSSPTVKTRSITPENAKKIRKMAEEGIQHGRTLTASRVSSDGHIKQRETFQDQRKVQTVKARPSKVRAQLDMNSDTYQVPRPSNSNGEGVQDKSNTSSNSPPTGRRGPSVPYDATDVYSVPRPSEIIEDVYKVPSNVQAPATNYGNAHSQDVYSVPRGVTNGSPAGGIYNTPRKAEEEHGSNYDTPRNAQSASPPKFTRSASGKENSKPAEDLGDIDEELPARIGKMRPTRSFESLHRRRVNTSVSDVPQRPVGVYMDIELDRPIHPAKNAPLPPLPQLPGGPAPPETAKPISESVYWEISDEAIEKNRSRLRNTTGSTSNRSPAVEKARSKTISPHSDHYARPRLPEPAVPQYFDIDLKKPAAGSPQVRHGNRPMDVPSGQGMSHSSSASSVLSSKPSRVHSDGDRNSFTEPDPSVLGTSTPLEDEVDEYVIVTGADRRPKVNSNPRMPTSMTAPKVDDEYEVMTSARAENIVQRQLQRVQYPTQFPSHYSTPDPSLYSHPTSNAPTTSAVPLPQQDYPKERSSPVLRCTQNVEENTVGGVSMDDLSPCDDQPTYHNVTHQRKSSNLSVSSTQSDGNDEVDGTSTDIVPSTGGVAMVRNTELVKTMAGSPLNPAESNHLKSQTRSLGNILEESHYQVPPTRSQNKSPSTSPPTSPLLQHHTPSSMHRTASSGTPTTKKHHDYVNHMMNDGSRPSTPDKGSPSLKQKRPQPLPRIQRGESVNSETC